MEPEREPQAAAAARKAVSGIRSWAEDDRPREKMVIKGSDALSDTELVAILLRTGHKPDTALDLARRLMRTADHDLQKLSRFSLEEFTKIRGLGKAKAIALMAAFELGRRKCAKPSRPGMVVMGSKTTVEMLQPRMGDLPHEEFTVLLLDNNSRLLHMECLTVGGIAMLNVDTRIIMRKALEHKASKMIVCHNHPSGDPEPSRPDIVFTEKLKGAAQLLEIRLLDHVIITSGGYYSFADHSRI